jgi:hypothetical protein
VCVALGWCGGQLPSKGLYQAGEYAQAITPAGGQPQTLSAHSSEELAIKVRAVEQQNPGVAYTKGAVVEPWKFTVETFSQLLTAYYFAFFLLILPLLGLRETPGRVPETIAKSVLGDKDRPVAAE